MQAKELERANMKLLYDMLLTNLILNNETSTSHYYLLVE
jgi:hypothetical protein